MTAACTASLFHIGMRLLGPCLVIMALVLKGWVAGRSVHVCVHVCASCTTVLSIFCGHSWTGFVTCTFFWHALPIMQDRAGLIGSSLLSFVGVFLLLNALPGPVGHVKWLPTISANVRFASAFAHSEVVQLLQGAVSICQRMCPAESYNLPFIWRQCSLQLVCHQNLRRRVEWICNRMRRY